MLPAEGPGTRLRVERDRLSTTLIGIEPDRLRRLNAVALATEDHCADSGDREKKKALSLAVVRLRRGDTDDPA